MPSKTAKQARTMQAASQNSDFARKMGIPQDVAEEFRRADTSHLKKPAPKGRRKPAKKPASEGYY